MIATQIALVRRELWEHRSILIVPLVIAVIESLGSLVTQVTVSGAGQAIDVALLGASSLGENERSAMLNVFLTSFSFLFVLAMGILMIFYALDALYAERKDKSILFWRSLPVTDAETVVSKLAVALLLIPAVTFAMIAVTHLVVLTITSIWVGFRGADASFLIWQAAPLLDNWGTTFVVVLALALWVSPFVGWFLFVSAFTKRSPFLIAFLPLVVVPMLESIVLRSWNFGAMLLARAPFNVPIFGGVSDEGFIFDDEEELLELAETGVSFFSLIDVGRFLTDIDVWIGLIVCGLLCFGAVYVRRFRDES